MRQRDIVAAVAAFTGIALGGASVVGHAQAPVVRQTTPIFRAGTDIVEMDVSVLDKDRRPVTGLTAADFTVLEDGVPRKVGAFSFVEVPGAEEPAAAWMRAASPDVVSNQQDDRRLVVLLLDDRDVPFGPGIDLSVGRLTQRLARAVVDQLGPSDLASVAYSYHGDLGQDFTTDRAKLRQAIDRFNAGAAAGWPRGLLTRLVTTLGAVPGRQKIVFYIGNGDDLAPDGPVKKAFYQAAQRANVHFYCLDAAGLAGPAVFGRSPNLDPHGPARQRLLDMAENTGGRAIVNTNAPQDQIPDIFRENASYYLVGFEPSTPIVPGSNHRVEVKVDRRDVTVRSTREFDVPTESAAAFTTRAAAQAEPLAGPLPAVDLPLRIVAAPFNVEGSGASVALVLRVTEPGIPSSTADTLQVEMRAFTPDGDPESAAIKTVRWPARPDDAGDRDGEILSSIDLAPGRHELRVSVASAALGKIGSVFADVDVPNFKKAALSLSGVALTSSSAPHADVKLASALLLLVTPTTTREFSATDRVTAFLRVYEGGAASLSPAQVAIRVTDGHDQVVFSSTESAVPEPTTRAADVRVNVPLVGLTPGPYLLSITATRGTDTSTRDVVFSVK